LNSLLEHLTPAQREAVQHIDGPLLILAGPGSGKTRVVTRRIAYLVHRGVPARHILALTFTNKASEEMLARVRSLIPGESVWASTFHRFCARLLREHASLVGLEPNFTIYDTDDSRRALRRVMAELRKDWSLVTPERISAEISRAKNNLVTAQRYGRGPATPIGYLVAEVYPAYQQLLLGANAVDFDDLLLHVAQLLREQGEVRRSLDQRYRYILVDEYQDTNLAQYAIVRALSINAPNLAVTGDPDQSIYGWRGANLKNILEFERDFPDTKIVRLEQNYRSTQSILRVADALISRNLRRKRKSLFTDNPEGQAVRLSTYATHEYEALAIAEQIAGEIGAGRRRPRDYAIFYRVNALSRSLEAALRTHGIPYQMIHSVEFYQRQEIRDILAYLKLINNPRDSMALVRVINTPPRGIGKKTVERLTDFARQRGMALLEAARQGEQIAELSKRAAAAVMRFVSLYDRLTRLIDQPIEEMVGRVLELSGYQQRLEKSDAREDQERLANIQELLTDAREFDRQHPDDGSLETFLERASLVNDTDAWEAANDCVTLMTLHAAKGLEFPVVYIVAIEEGLLPHARSLDSADQLEEERRLLFVGLTRAEEELRLSHARYRDFRGRSGMTVPSPFLNEMPREEMQHETDTLPPTDFASADFPSTATPRRRSPSATARRNPAKLITAAHLAGEMGDDTSRASPDVFYHGMRVKHPEYGLGTVVALSHEGMYRGATVEFEDASVGERRFLLAHSKLEPAEDA